MPLLGLNPRGCDYSEHRLEWHRLVASRGDPSPTTSCPCELAADATTSTSAKPEREQQWLDAASHRLQRDLYASCSQHWVGKPFFVFRCASSPSLHLRVVEICETKPRRSRSFESPSSRESSSDPTSCTGRPALGKPRHDTRSRRVRFAH